MDKNEQTILIVDDSRIIRVALKKILKDNYDVVEAEDGLIAYDKISKQPIDLVITDLEMPNLNGFGLIEKIRYHSSPEIKHIPILAISGDNLKKEESKALNMGATDLIIKPFHSADIHKSISALMRLSEAFRKERQDAGNIDQEPHIDTLTGLGNLSYFRLRADQELAYAKRHHSRIAIALVHFDGLSIHQTLLGKNLSYQLVKQTGKFIVNSARVEDTVARIKEDTFGVILSMCNILEAKAMVDRLMKRVHETSFKLGKKSIKITLSIGVSSINVKNLDNVNDLVEQAYRGLDKALALGGDTIILSGESINSDVPIDSFENLMDFSLKQIMGMSKDDDRRLEPYLPELLESLIPLLKQSYKHYPKETKIISDKIKGLLNN